MVICHGVRCDDGVVLRCSVAKPVNTPVVEVTLTSVCGPAERAGTS